MYRAGVKIRKNWTEDKDFRDRNTDVDNWYLWFTYADLVLEEELHHLEVLVVDGHEEGAPPQGVHTVNVDLSILAVLQHPAVIIENWLKMITKIVGLYKYLLADNWK